MKGFKKRKIRKKKKGAKIDKGREGERESIYAIDKEKSCCFVLVIIL